VLFYKRIQVGDNERALLFRNERLVEILGPGVHYRAQVLNTLRVERHSVTSLVFTSDSVDFLVKSRPDLVNQHFLVVETGDLQVALVRMNGILVRVVGPGCRVLFWLGYRDLTAQMVNVLDSPEVDKDLTLALMKLGRESLALFTAVEEAKAGLLYLDNRFVRVLGPGNYAFWALRAPRVDVIDLRRQTLEVTGQEILTKDKVTLRVNITAEFKVVDPAKAGTLIRSFSDHLYRQLQLAVRQTLGKRTLDEVLAEKVDVDPAMVAEVRSGMATLGVEVGDIALKDMILPGEIREILNQVVAAEKQAQANLIRRREETAATRSLLNTANLMKDNPVLMRLKELETLEKLTEKVGSVNLHGGGFQSLLTKLME